MLGRSGCSPQVLVDSRAPKVCDDMREFCGFRGSSLVLENSRFCSILEESSSFGSFWRSPPALTNSQVLEFAFFWSSLSLPLLHFCPSCRLYGFRLVLD